MASEGASGSDRSDSSSNSNSASESSKADSVSKETSDKARDAISGGSGTSTAAEATASDREASQSKMEAEGRAAKAGTPMADPVEAEAVAEDVSFCMHDVVANEVQCIKNGSTFEVEFDGWAPNATEQSITETLAVAEHFPEFRTAEHMERLSSDNPVANGIRDAHLRQAAARTGDPVMGRSEWENIAAVSGGVIGVAALARVRGMRQRGTGVPSNSVSMTPIERLRPEMGNFTPTHGPANGAAIDPRLPTRPNDAGTTHGVVETPNGPVFFQSSATGPGQAHIPGRPEVNYSGSHVEGHAAALMREHGIADMTITINNVRGPCGTCVGTSQASVGNILPEGSTLTVRYMDQAGDIQTYDIRGFGE